MPLPGPVLIKRINNEISSYNQQRGVDVPEVPTDASFPLEITINLKNQPAYATEERMIKNHTCTIIVSEDYPFRKPDARWKTPIYHPNIMNPEDGGYVCIKTLDTWEFNSTLTSFIKSLEYMVANPNPYNPFGTKSCIDSARFFSDNTAETDMTINYGGKNA